MVDLLLEPELAATLVNEVAKVIFGLTEIYLDSVGHELDILEFPGDDYAGNVNLIISRELFDRFFKPYWRRLVEMAKHGWPNVHVVFHSDGAIAPFLAPIIETGVDVIHPLEPVEVTDLAEVKYQFGQRVTFMGAIDIKQGITGTKERVVEEVRRGCANSPQAAATSWRRPTTSSGTYRRRT
jgi:uroporphyrinogen decarboxylase